MSTISFIGTPTLTAATASNSMSVTGTWGTSQSPVANDLLTAAVTAYGTTTAVLGSAPTGWTLVSAEIINQSTISAHYQKVAVGSDSAPTFTATCTGTAGDASLQVVLYIARDSGGGVPVLTTTGLLGGTSGTIAPTTDLAVPSSGCGAIVSGIASQGTTAATTTWTTPTNWTLGGDQIASLRSQMASYYTTSSSALSSGSKLSATLTHSRTSTFQAATILVIAPAGTTAGIYVVQHGQGFGSNVSSFTVSFPAPTTAGNALYAAISEPENDTTVSSVELGGSADNWAAQLSQTNATFELCAIWQDPNNAGGSASVAITLSAAEYPCADIYEVAGMGNAPTLDVSSVNEANNSAATWTSNASGTSGVASEFVLGLVVGFNNAATAVTVTGASSPWSDRLQITSKTGLYDEAAHQVSSSTGTFTYNGSTNISSGNNGFTAMVAAFKPGTSTITTSGGLALVKPALSGTVTVPTVTSGSLALVKPALSGTTTSPATTSGGLALSKPAFSGTVAVAITTTGAVALPKPALSGSAASGSVITTSGGLQLPKPALAGTETQVLTVGTLTLPDAVVGAAYSVTLVAWGGVPPFTWSIISGSLPVWATLNASTGEISGTPTSGETGTVSFTVEVTDSAGGGISGPTGPSGDFTLAWNDEFNDGSGMSGPTNGLDSSKWNVGFYFGPSSPGGTGYSGKSKSASNGAGAIEFYGPGAISFSDDNMVLSCFASGHGPDGASYTLGSFTSTSESGGVNTAGLMCITPNTGYSVPSAIADTVIQAAKIVVEVECQMPGPTEAAGAGTDGAYWTYIGFYDSGDCSTPDYPNSGTWTEEIDVWEAFTVDGSDGSDYYTTFHAASAYGSVVSAPSSMASTDLALAMHKFTVEFTETSMTVWVDGVQATTVAPTSAEVSAQFATPQYLNLQLQLKEGYVATGATSAEGAVATPWLVNYVRVFTSD